MIFAITIPGWQQLVEGIAYALKYMYEFTGSFGLAIILLTIAMRLVMFPLTYKQTKSMIAMQRIMPQMKEVQKKYKDDREKQGQEMMALYKENKVSPFSSCLPMILQMPIIFAVFEVLRGVSEKGSSVAKIVGTSSGIYMFLGMDLRDAGSALWSKGDIAQLIVLIVLTVFTGYLSAIMMSTDQKQTKMMSTLMPVMMGFFAWILPAGVTVYLVVTNVLTIGQQYFQLEREGFYDEKKNEKRKSGEPLKWFEKVGFAVTDFGSDALIKMKMKPEPVKSKKKKAGSQATKKSTGSKQAQSKSGSEKQQTTQKSKQEGTSPQKKEVSKEKQGGQKKPAQSKSQKNQTSKSGTTKKKDYPAKKK